MRVLQHERTSTPTTHQNSVHQFTSLREAATPLVTREHTVVVLVAGHEVRVQARLHVVVVDDLDLRPVEAVTVVRVDLTELPHHRLEAVTLSFR